MSSPNELSSQDLSHSPETPPESRLIFQDIDSFDRDGIIAPSTYCETSLWDHGDGSRTVRVTRHPLAEAPSVEVEDKGFSGSLAFNTIEALSKIENSPLKPVLGLLGFHARKTAEGNGYEATYLTSVPLNERLDFIRNQTGFALKVKPYDGTVQTAKEMSNDLDAFEFSVSTHPLLEIHDTLYHVPAWALLPKSTHTKIASRTREVVDTPVNSLSIQFGGLEKVMNVAALGTYVADCMRGADNSRAAEAADGQIYVALFWIISGSPATDESRQAADEETEAVIARAHELITVAQRYIAEKD